MADKNVVLHPAYLIDGENHLKRDAALKRMRMRLEKEGDLSFNSDTFNGQTASAEAIITACKTLPFASERRLVVVNDADRLSKKSQSSIAEYIENPSDTTVLLLVSDKLPKSSAIFKAIKKISVNAYIDCTPPKAKELPAQVQKMGMTYGIKLTSGAVSALIGLVGEDTIHLDSEVEKLALAHPKLKEITENEVKDLVSRVAEPKPWEFVDALTSRNIGKSVMLFERMRSTSPHSLLRQCVNRLRELICAKTIAQRSPGTAEAQVAAALKTKDFIARYRIRDSRNFTAEELRSALIASVDVERKMKSGTDPESAFIEWALGIARR